MNVKRRRRSSSCQTGRLAIPPGLDGWRTVPGGSRWLDSLPDLVADCSDRWRLRIGEPYQPASIALVVPVDQADGMPAVLKVNFPEPESEHEAAALAFWDGRGAVRLLASDPERSALLIERCSPGHQLLAVEDNDEVTVAAAAVMERLWRSAPGLHPFRYLSDEAARWAVELPAGWTNLGRPFERRILDEAVAACLDLGGAQGPSVVLHQDLHAGNILRALREPWLAIDPKPLVGERPFDAASLLRDRLWGGGRAGCSRGRPSTARHPRRAPGSRPRTDPPLGHRTHTLAWGVSGSKVYPDMIVAARSLIEIGR